MQSRDETNGKAITAAKVVRHTTPDGRVIYDTLSLIRSPEAKKHFERLDRLAEKGLVPKPEPAKP